MLKEELIKTLKSKRSLFIFAYLIIVAIGDNICGISQTGESGGYFNAHPTYMSLLSGQSALVFYALFVWIMPITLILLYCARYNQEQKGHLQYIYISKMGRRKYFLSKIYCSFIVSAVYSAIPLLLNLFVSVLFLHGGTTFADVENWNVMCLCF